MASVRIGTFIGCALAAGVLAGCANAPHGKNAKPTEQRATRSGTGRPAAAPKTADSRPGGAEPNVVTKPQNYVPHHWPAPEQDAWSRIRAGFELAPHKDKRSVRVWTQFYATHTRHLSASLRRARPFLWHVIQQVNQRGLPSEIALLPIVESGYNPTATSYKGASGLWQFMPRTADYMRLTRDWWYDERDDPIASTDAALNYLQALNQRYDGDWLLALAAYNAGPGRVDNAIAKAKSKGQATDYWNLDLPEETEQYVPQLLALRRIMMTPARFGVSWPRLANQPRTRTVQLPGQTSMKVAARLLEMPETQLHRLNPGMRRWASEPGDKRRLLVPAAKAAAFKTKLAQIDPRRLINRQTHVVRRGDVLSRLARSYGVSVAALRQSNGLASNRIRVGQALTIPRPGNSESTPSTKPSQSYVVQSGDTLSRIARRYHVSVASLERANGSAADTLHPGDRLDIPSSARPPEPSTVLVQRGDSLWSIANANNATVADLRRWNRMKPGAPLTSGSTIAVDGPAPLPDYYEVESGDSLWSIASRFSMQVNTLRSLNDMNTQAQIRPGERLRLQPAVSG